ncbi:MAG: class I SAM-dependent methyltransferase [Syntrophotaleaceae bacterium]
MTSSEWSTEIVNSRICDAAGRKRYAAGSPDLEEVEAYSRCLPENSRIGVVLGMTPELRNLAARHCIQLICIDHSGSAISTYRDWLSPSLAAREHIIQGDWNDLKNVLPEPADFILGDGIFGNVVPFADYSSLLGLISSALSPRGCFVTRQCLMLEGIPENGQHRQWLLKRYRNKDLDEAGFGLSMRLHGYADMAYDRETSILDNKKVFAAIEADFQAGFFQLSEYQIIRRYFFQGLNSIPSKENWETMLKANNFRFERQCCKGKYWYQYYSIYSCRPAERGQVRP